MTDQTTPPPPPPVPGTAAPASPYAAAPQPLSAADEKLWATLVHIGGILFQWIPPLIGYLVLKDRGPLIREHTLTALNFQLTMLIALVVGYILTFVIIFAAGVLILVFGILAALAANRGEYYTYPLSIKFVS